MLQLLKKQPPAYLPEVRGKLRHAVSLAASTWFAAGGDAEILFRPEDVQDLSHFLAYKPDDLAVNILGIGSNILVRDGGIDGVVIRLGRGFADCRVEGDRIVAGAGCLNSSVVMVALEHGIGGLEFLSGIPGGIGGALAMNAGAYGTEIKDILLEAQVLDSEGTIHTLTVEQLYYRYRTSGLPEGWIFTQGVFQGKFQDKDKIKTAMDQISSSRNATQPVRTHTGGSTFKNPANYKAWQLIDAAGCRGLRIGGAQMSELHCNFMINTGNAIAAELEALGEEVRKRVFEHSGIALEWEIKIMGNNSSAGIMAY